MKKALFFIFTMLLIFSINYLPISFAQDSLQFSLPEGATAQFGKGSVNQIQYSPDGTRLAVASSIGIWLYDTSNYQEETLLVGHTKNVNCIAFSPDGKTLASGSFSSAVILWDVITNTKKHTFSSKQKDLIQLRSVAFSPDVNILAGGSFETVQLWNVVKGELKLTLQGHTGDVHSVAFSPDGKLLASGCDVEYIGEDHSLGYKGIRLWDAETGEQKQTLKGEMGDIYSVAFSPDGSMLASGEGWADYAIRLWDVVTGEQKLTFKGHTGNVNSVAFSSDGSMLASGSGDSTIRLWDVATGKHIQTFKGHTWYVNSVIFSEDGTMLASGSYDGTVLLWNIVPPVNAINGSK